MDQFEADGFWFLPDNPDHRVSGMIRYTHADGVRIELNGLLEDDLPKHFGAMSAQTYPLVYGIVNSGPFGRSYTLQRCFQTGMSLSMPGYATERLFATVAFAGACHLESKDFTFTELRFRVADLVRWYFPASINYKWLDSDSTERGVDISYRSSRSIVVTSGDIRLVFSPTYSLSPSPIDGVVLRPDVIVEAQLSSPRDLSGLWRDVIQPLTAFLTLAVGRPAHLASLTVSNPAIEEVARQNKWVNVLQQTGAADTDASPVHSALMLLPAARLGERLSEVIANWYSFYSRHWWFCAPYFSHEFREAPYINTRFWELLQCLIAFYRYRVPGADNLAAAIANVVAQVDKAETGQRWAELLMPDRAQLQFGQFLEQELNRFADLMMPLIDSTASSFVIKVAQMAAREQKGEKGAETDLLKGRSIHHVIETLRCLAQAWMLEGIGFSVEETTQLLQSTQHYAFLSAKKSE